ncbi:hypothetical protein RYH73_17655 [Olivibacter sp. CPCC 100613]|uniref:hypothetical protein n=1 Tax=Olivibacter sp. CPCC 100613 TaxID=3079931 RepID=UPI002FF6711D
MTNRHLFIDENTAFHAYQDALVRSLLLEIHYQSCGIKGVVYGKYIPVPAQNHWTYSNSKMGTLDSAQVADFFVDNDSSIYLNDIEAYLKTFSPTTELYRLKAIVDHLSGQKNWELIVPWTCSDTVLSNETEDLIRLANNDGIILAQKLAIQFGLQIDARSGVNLLAAICLQMMSIRKITVFTLLYGVWSEAQLCELIYQAKNDAVYYSDKITFLEYRIINEVLM